MNKNVKFFLVAINVLMILLAFFWYKKTNDTEPIIVILGQIISIITLLNEKKASNITSKQIFNKSKLKIDAKVGDNITTENVDNSTINIKTNE